MLLDNQKLSAGRKRLGRDLRKNRTKNRSLSGFVVSGFLRFLELVGLHIFTWRKQKSKKKKNQKEKGVERDDGTEMILREGEEGDGEVRVVEFL